MARPFLELYVKGGGRALVEPSMIGALIMKGELAGAATDTSPLGVILKGYGDMLEVVGISAYQLMAKIDRVSVKNKMGLFDAVTLDGENFQRDTVIIHMEADDEV